jgi:hypothetical protein
MGIVFHPAFGAEKNSLGIFQTNPHLIYPMLEDLLISLYEAQICLLAFPCHQRQINGIDLLLTLGQSNLIPW